MNYDEGRIKVMALFPPLHQHYCIIPKTKDGHTCVQMCQRKDGEKHPLLLPKRRYLMFLPVSYWSYDTFAVKAGNCILF